ncbi:hypothetical protein [uncultured Bacteroides sp.]|uniref:hypothetical protein n=1 Tax=uncultured Bacteroides sp. TaxID=162156 RepID=UPI00280C16C0|nr:hypothetical protein [uncultured Bacteroides sp.]
MANISQIKIDSNWGDAASTLNSNFQNMNVDLEKVKSSTTKFKGYFTTEAALKQAYPSPKVGDTAWVGSTYPGTVYNVQTDGTWYNTGTAPDTETVDLTDYAKKEELTELDTKIDKRTTEYNVSVNNPTSGIDGSNKYDLAGAIAQVPSELRSSVNTVSFLNQAGKTEKWEFAGGSWVVGSFSQVGAGEVNKQGIYNVDANIPLSNGFYTSTTARNAVPSSVRKLGLIITYKTDENTSVTEQFSGSDISAWTDDTNWGSIGSGGGNKILTWDTDAATTRKQVPLKDRKELLIISYKNGEGDTVNEQYIGTDLDDDSWESDIYWQKFLVEGDSQVTIEGISKYLKKRYILKSKDGKISISEYAFECVLDFYRVKKGEKIRVISNVLYDKSIICFYRDKSEDSFVESVDAFENKNWKDITLKLAEYTPSEDGYIRVCGQYDSTQVYILVYDLDLKKILDLPCIIIGGEESILDKFDETNDTLEIEGYEHEIYVNRRCLYKEFIGDNLMETDYYASYPVRVKKGDIITVYSNTKFGYSIFQFLSKEEEYKCIYYSLGEADKTVTVNYIAPSDGLIMISYNKAEGEWASKGVYNGKKLPYLKIERPSESDDTQGTSNSVTDITELEGVQDYSLENLFDKNSTRAYDSDFAEKVNEAIGRKTDSTGCYSNNISCRKGDWFTRSDFGTGIVLVLDGSENILGDIKNAAYSPTIQIAESEGQDFTSAVSVVFVVPIANIDTEKIVKAKYLPTEQGNYFKMPKFRLDQLNIPNGLDYPIKSTSGRFYSIIVDDSGEEPILKYIVQEGIPMSNLPQNFPLFSMIGDFSNYYDYLIFCPIEGGVTNYLYELSSTGLVARYINKKVNCPRILKENNEWYFYGVDGYLNTSSGKLNIYKAKEETFELVKGNLGNSKGEYIEPHDCLVISVNPLHYICQRYVPNTTTIVNGESKVVTALHLEEVYEGEQVWEWHSEDYPELWTDSHVQSNNADYLHNNTISIGSDNNLYVNNKQANQMLVIKRTWDNSSHTGSIGDILWKIGGNKTHSGWDVSTRIKTTDEQQWYESHDAVINSDGSITMFDNGNTGASRVLDFSIDTNIKILTNFKQYTYNSYKGRYMGSVDRAANGIYLVSWGSSRSGNTANAGLYDFNTGKALFEIRFNATGSSAYRVYGIKKGE